MVFASPRPFLARLRASTRLAALVLLVFALKVGAAAACAKHDIVELGLDAGNGSAWATVADSDGSDGSGDPSAGVPGHAGGCTHCQCHHAAALLLDASVVVWASPSGTTFDPVGSPPSTRTSLELRPPIA